MRFVEEVEATKATTIKNKIAIWLLRFFWVVFIVLMIYAPFRSHYRYKELSDKYMNKQVCVADSIYGEVVDIPSYGDLVVFTVKLQNGRTFNFAEGQVDLMVKQSK